LDRFSEYVVSKDKLLPVVACGTQAAIETRLVKVRDWNIAVVFQATPYINIGNIIRLQRGTIEVVHKKIPR
jgi:hypothetical protein